MNYDKIILEMLSRIQSLEEKVQELQNLIGDDARESDVDESSEPRVTTADIRAFIEEKKKLVLQAGEHAMVLRASEIHHDMKLSKRYPMVCNAMRQCMGSNDTILHETASGYSSSLEIQYVLDD